MTAQSHQAEAVSGGSLTFFDGYPILEETIHSTKLMAYS